MKTNKMKNIVSFFKFKDTGNIRIRSKMDDHEYQGFYLEKEKTFMFLPKYWQYVHRRAQEKDIVEAAMIWLKRFNKQKSGYVPLWDSSKNTALLNIRSEMYGKISGIILKETYTNL